MKALYYGDNLQVLRDSIVTESVDLIYLDPPFNSNATVRRADVRCWRVSRHLAEWALTSAYSQKETI
jgi:16S rRNA G966 N2-methylase RsmD